MNDFFEPENFYRIGMTTLKIANNYVDGLSSLRILIEILDFQKNHVEKYIEQSHLINQLHGVCFQSVIINLSNILVDDKDSINIYYLSGIIENYNKSSKKLKEFSGLCDPIKEVIGKFPRESVFYLGLKELRDKYIAHNDKVRFQSALGVNNKIDLQELKLAFDSIGLLIDKFVGILGINEELVPFEQIEMVTRQFRDLLHNKIKNDPKIL